MHNNLNCIIYNCIYLNIKTLFVLNMNETKTNIAQGYRQIKILFEISYLIESSQDSGLSRYDVSSSSGHLPSPPFIISDPFDLLDSIQ